MPIVAAYSPMEASITSAWSMGKGATVPTSTQMFCTAVGTGASMGLYPVGVSMVPLTPSGVSAATSLMTSALSMGKGAQINTTSQLMALAISVIAPLCPPVGLSTLGYQIEASMSHGKGAQVSTTSQLIAQAVVNYYVTGGTQ